MKSVLKKTNKKEEKKEEKVETQKRSVSDEAAKSSVVKDEMQTRRMPGESLSAWKYRVGLSKEKPKKVKKIK